jgi:mannan endo-1,4-beta-mannosidase
VLDVALPRAAHDPVATRRARERVSRTLHRLSRSARFALGHEDATAYGVGWKGDVDRSDVKSVCGSHVAVYGWDVFGLERDAAANGDGVGFEQLRRLMIDAHRRGGLNTISWHLDNPASEGDAWDNHTPAVRDVLPGGRLAFRLQTDLDRLANYLHTLRGDAGELLPIIFRPYHEHTGSWFWWGGSNTNAEDYVALFRHTVDYLRGERGLSNLLIAFSPGADEPTTATRCQRRAT